MKSKSSGYPRGFTLIEVIVTLVIVAVLGAMIYTYLGKAFYWGKLTDDSDNKPPVTRLKQSTALHRVMQNITADYNVYPQWRGSTVYATGIFVIPRNFNGRYYKCTAGGTSHATNEPAWPGGGGTVVDGTVTWTDSGRVRDLVPLYSTTNPKNLKQRIGTEGSVQSANEYGKNADGTYTTYTVVTNRFIKLDGGTESDDATGNDNILKVTLKNDQGESLTAIFYSEKAGG